ncbi:MAG TPA: diguanylate cyclase, partial [Candidatus Manganitrophaceae bacterium]|nr:diguanylate cyclase [Candidatus Manganitrophaceae bacterium]
YRHKFTVILAQIHLQATDVEESGLSIALQELGYRFYKRIRITDIGARHENKFFILLPETDYENAQKVLKSLTEQMKEFFAESQKSGGAQLTAELAAVEYPKDADTVEGLITLLETKVSREG